MHDRAVACGVIAGTLVVAMNVGIIAIELTG